VEKLLTTVAFLLMALANVSYGQDIRTINYPNGNVYVGEFKDDEYNGQGTIIYADQSRYVGEWRLLADHLVAAEY
jgi:hypothetical protein|tara:strand:+ start:69 stop:293 length:225 start_codon:yes stop_codon:yes gene_type:complete